MHAKHFVCEAFLKLLAMHCNCIVTESMFSTFHLTSG